MRPARGTTFSTRLLAAGAAAAGVLLLAGCGSEPGPAAGGAAAGSPVGEAHNDADVDFVKGMTPHHEGALTMSALAPPRAASPEVKALAARIAGAQRPEIEQMAAMAQAWGVPVEPASGHGSGHGGGHGSGHGGGHGSGHGGGWPSVHQLGGQDDTTALQPLSGVAFDREFLTRMIAHHRGAIQMARTELADGESASAKQLAEQILRDQTSEIAEMEQLLTQL